MKRLLALAVTALLMIAPTLAPAGSSEGGQAILPPDEVATFSDQVQRELASKGARVAIVARTGRDPAELPEGVRYTHVAYWVYSHITRSDGSTGFGYRAYNLYQKSDDLTVSHLVQDTPAEFYAGAYRLDAGIIIPDPRLQEKLLQTIASPTYANLHNSDYSVLANPMNGQFQNCTEHTLDVIFASLYETNDRAQIKADITAYFEPQPIEVTGFKRLVAPIASEALRTTDHGHSIGTATFGSLARFMAEYGLADAILTVTPDGIRRY